jgi:GYF domain 2
MEQYFIIGGDGKQYGPITGDDMRKWIVEGRLNATSSAKAESDAEWRTLGTFPQFASDLGLQNATGGSQNPPPELTGPEWEAQITRREPELKLGECLGAGWTFLGANAGFLIGAVLLTWIANLFFVSLSVAIPLIGAIIYICFNGVIMGGFYLACLRRMRGEAVPPTEVFSGFKVAFAQLMLTGLVSSLLTEFSVCFLILPAIYLAVAWVFALPLVADKKMPFWPAMELSRKVVTRIWFEALALVLVAFLPMIIFQAVNLFSSAHYFMGLYGQANGNWQQLAQTIQSQNGDFRRLVLEMTGIGQVVFLVNLLYCAGVLMRAYENLFGQKKP